MNQETFDTRYTRYRGAGLLVIYIVENGPSTWSALNSHACEMMKIDNSFEVQRIGGLGRLVKKGRGFYSEYFSPPWGFKPFFERSTNGLYHLTPRGKDLATHLEAKLKNGKDPKPSACIDIKKLKKNDRLRLIPSRWNAKTKTKLAAALIKHFIYDDAAKLTIVKYRGARPKNTSVWFPILKDTEVKFVDMLDRYTCIVKYNDHNVYVNINLLKNISTPA